MLPRRALFTSLLACVVLAGCSDAPPPAVSTPPAASAKAPASAKPPTSAKAPVPVSEVVFSTVQECTKAKYTQAQCSRGQSVASSMFHASQIIYPTKAECDQFFVGCVGTSASAPKKGFYPAMVKFSMGNEKPGVDVAPSPSNPLWYAPVFQGKDKSLVYLLMDHKGGLAAIPVKSRQPPGTRPAAP